MRQRVESLLTRLRYGNVHPQIQALTEQVQDLQRQVEALQQSVAKEGAYPAGHFHSPIPDHDEVLAYLLTQKPPAAALPDVEMNQDGQRRVLNEYIPFYQDLPFPEEPGPECRYYYHNECYAYADAIFLYCFLRKHQPRRIIEVGSGFSSAVMLDTVDRFFSVRPEITFIDPSPDRLHSLLREGDAGHVTIISSKVQQVPPQTFSCLGPGDLLFIDSSHVLKCGSDVQTLMFDVLPLLPPGIFVHFHDIFYPFDYHPQWLLDGWYWNESYLLRAFLAYNSEWSVYFYNTYVAFVFEDLIQERMPLCARNPGGSLYIQRSNPTAQRRFP